MGKSLITSNVLVEALETAGIVPDRTRRVVIDLQVGEVPILHIEQYGDTDLLDVFRALDGVEVSRVTAPAKAEQDHAHLDEPNHPEFWQRAENHAYPADQQGDQPPKPEEVRDFLLLVGERVDVETIRDQWSPAEREEAAKWAAAVHLSASDNLDVDVPERPAWLDAWTVEDPGHETAPVTVGAIDGAGIGQDGRYYCSDPDCDGHGGDE